jgi:cullin 1
MSSSANTTPVTIEQGWENEIKPKAIEPLERILNEGLKDRRNTDLFAPKEYVHIYT